MKHNHPILFLLVIMLAGPFMVSCEKAAKDTSAEDLQAVKAASEQFTNAYNQGDAAALAALFTEEAKRLPPNNPMMVGRESIQAIYEASFNGGVSDLQLTVIDFNVGGNMAHEVGKYTVTIRSEEGEAISESGKYVRIWKRVNGSWKVDVLIFNSSEPLPAPEEEATEEE